MKQKTKVSYILILTILLGCSRNNQSIEQLFNDKKYNEVINKCDEILEQIKSNEALKMRAKSYYYLGNYHASFKDFFEL